MASFDGNGLVIDRLADVRDDIEGALREAFGDGINLSDTSPFGVITGIMAERYSLLWEILESVYEASFPNTSFGIYLDELVAFNGILREEATTSAVDLTFQRSTDTGTGEVTIPIGTQVTASGGSTTIWATTIEGTIANLSETATVPASADEVGPIGALAGTLTVMANSPPNIESVTNPLDAVLGADEETDAELKLRRATQLGRSGTSTESGIRSALQLLTEIRAVALVLNDTDVAVGDLPPHSFEAFVAPETGVDLGQTITLAYDADLVTLNSISLEINALAIAASPVIFNTSNFQTLDDIATALQAESLVDTATHDNAGTITIVGNSNTDFTLASTVTLGASQANSEINPINTAGAAMDVVAQTLWDSKSAGIQTYGTLSGIAVDTEGDPHQMFFSDIEAQPIWVKVKLLNNTGDYDAVTAEPAIAAALAQYATSFLTPGVTVLNYKLVSAVSAVNAVGITTIVVETSTDNGNLDPFSQDNIPMLVSQFATIDSGDVTFEYI
jgi:uncharacterized phage protein gp47/JayE